MNDKPKFTPDSYRIALGVIAELELAGWDCIDVLVNRGQVDKTSKSEYDALLTRLGVSK